MDRPKLLAAVVLFWMSAAPVIANTTVAILEAECISTDVKTERSELTAWLDTVLTENATEQKQLSLVDRQWLQNVLAEKKLGAMADDAAIKPFVASGVLICPTIIVDAGGEKVNINIQAVLAQRGSLLAELTVSGELAGKTWKTAPQIQDGLKDFWVKIDRQQEIELHRPSFAVSRIGLVAKQERLQWMADDLTDFLIAAPRKEVNMLVPRQPVHTKEERLLRAMGLTRSADADKTTNFSASSDFQISGELTDSNKVGVAFEQTPVDITLAFSNGSKNVASTKISGAVTDYAKLREQALKWADEQLATALKLPARATDELDARAQCEQELVVARRLAPLDYGRSGLEKDRQVRLAMAALRACHLDPTNEESAYLAAKSIEGTYAARDQDGTLACKDRIIQLGQQYLDRFKSGSAQHQQDVLRALGSAGSSAAAIIRGKPGGTEAILAPPDLRQYPYARVYTWAWLEVSVREAANGQQFSSNALSSAPGHIRMHLIPNIPDDKLDDEYAFWRAYWKDNLQKLGDDVVPWEMMEVAFQARRRNPEAVRQSLQALAQKIPRTHSKWRLVKDNIIPLYLRTAGDKDWQSWQPKWSSSEIVVTYPDRTALYQRFSPPGLGVFDVTKIAPLDGMTHLVFDNDILERGRRNLASSYPKIQPIAEVDGDIWFITPGLWDTINYHEDHTLLVFPANQVRVDEPSFAAKATHVAWPSPQDEAARVNISCYRESPDGKTFWIGTQAQGVARFARGDHGWTGKWITARNGLPAGRVATMEWVESGKFLQIHGTLDRKDWLCRLNPATDTVHLLDTTPPALEFYPSSLQLFTSKEGKERHWQMRIGPFNSGDRWRIRQIDPATGKPIGQSLEGRPAYNGELSQYSVSHAPVDRTCTAISNGENIWMISHWQLGVKRGEGEVLMIYRPAPEEDKEWTSHDLWIGPFLDPQCLFALMSDDAGRIWLTSGSGVYVIDGKQFLSRREGTGFSTQQWQAIDRARRDKAVWPVRVRQLLAENQDGPALEIVEKELAAIGAVDASSPVDIRGQWTVAQLHKAMIQARVDKSRPAAVDLYQQLADCQWVEPAAREKSWACLIKVLATLERWNDVVRAAESGAPLFPHILNSPDQNSCHDIVELAKQKVRS